MSAGRRRAADEPSVSEVEQRLAAAIALCALAAANADICKLVVKEGGVAPLARAILPHVSAATRVEDVVGSAHALKALDALLERSMAESQLPRGATMSPVAAADANNAARQLMVEDAATVLRQLALALPEADEPEVRVELLRPLTEMALEGKAKAAEHATRAVLC